MLLQGSSPDLCDRTDFLQLPRRSEAIQAMRRFLNDYRSLSMNNARSQGLESHQRLNIRTRFSYLFFAAGVKLSFQMMNPIYFFLQSIENLLYILVYSWPSFMNKEWLNSSVLQAKRAYWYAQRRKIIGRSTGNRQKLCN